MYRLHVPYLYGTFGTGMAASRGGRCLGLAALSFPLARVAGLCPFSEVLPSSRAWTEAKDTTDTFQLSLLSPQPWRPFAHLVLEWRDRVEITWIEGAHVTRRAGASSHPPLFLPARLLTLVPACYTDQAGVGTVAVFELDDVQPSGRAIKIHGKGTLDVHPTLVCRWAACVPTAGADRSLTASARTCVIRYVRAARRRLHRDLGLPRCPLCWCCATWSLSTRW